MGTHSAACRQRVEKQRIAARGGGEQRHDHRRLWTRWRWGAHGRRGMKERSGARRGRNGRAATQRPASSVPRPAPGTGARKGTSRAKNLRNKLTSDKRRARRGDARYCKVRVGVPTHIIQSLPGCGWPISQRSRKRANNSVTFRGVPASPLACIAVSRPTGGREAHAHSRGGIRNNARWPAQNAPKPHRSPGMHRQHAVVWPRYP